jgi:hypothetical protein
MSFSILCTRSGTYRVILRGALTPSSSSLLRRELATVLVARPTDVEVCVLDRTLFGPAESALVESFFDILWARGCRLTVVHGTEPGVPVADRAQLRRQLVASE